VGRGLGPTPHTLKGHTGSIYSLAFSPDGHTLVSGSRDTTVRLWDAATGELLQILEGHTDAVWSLAFAPDGRTLASGGRDAAVRLWRDRLPTTGKPVTEPPRIITPAPNPTATPVPQPVTNAAANLRKGAGHQL
jgi:WD40 repeat protein